MRHFIGHRGRRISYLEAGAAKAAPGRTLVFVHAFPLCSTMWEPQLNAVPAGWRFLAPDLRGFGQSDPDDSATPSIDDYGEDVFALLDALDVNRAAVAGLSMGGYAVFSMLRLQPERVTALVLADTRAEADSETARAGRDAMLETLAQGGPAAVAERMLPSLLGHTTRTARHDIVELVRAMTLAQPADGIAAGLRRLKSRPDATALLKGIAAPVLVVVGEEDQITTPDSTRGLHRQIHGSQLAIIPQAGHLSNMEQPGLFNQALTAFLGSI